MDFLFHCRDKPDVDPLLERATEAHWSFMEGYSDRLRVRGPTLSADGEVHTGSLHIVALSSLAETETFAYQEPYYKAGCYGEVIIRRWHDRLGRPIGDFKSQGREGDEPLFLILGDGVPGARPPEPPRDLAPGHRDQLAAYGWTQSLDGAQWTGFAAVLPASALDVINALLADAPLIASLAVHRWCVGGRR
jgi:uncharacterized protein YciI